MQKQDIARAASLLMEARRGRRRIADLPPDLQPATIADAYAIQDAIVALAGTVGGWKVAPAGDKPEPRCAPILAANLHASPATLTAGELLVAPEIEVEIAVRFVKDLPARAQPYTTDDVLAAIGSIHPALEVLSSRFENRKVVPPLAAIADAQSNGSAVFGPALTSWQALEFATVSMTLTFDGSKVGTVDGGPSTALVLDSLVWLANHVATRHGGLKAGQVVITGARIKPVVVPKPGTAVTADVAGIGSVSATVG
jgi:2-keto-4-pentenoate hydratase